MSIETETLKTLERIEKLLEQSTASAKPDATSARRRVNIAGQKKGSDTDMKGLADSVFTATKSLDKLTSSSNKLSDSMRKARADVVLFRTGIRSTAGSASSSMSGLGSAVEAVIDKMGTLSSGKGGSNLAGIAGGATKVRVVLKALGAAKAAFEVLEKLIDAGVIPGLKKKTEATNEDTKATEEHTKEQKKQTGMMSGALSRMGISVTEAGERSEWLAGQFKNLGFQLTDAIINVTKDIYLLQSRGIDAGESLFSLYGHAMKAGMSLEEYTSMLGENSAAVVRATSMTAFRDSLRDTTKSLQQIGVFGPAANQLAAAMRTSSVQLGIPISQVDDVAKRQVETFKELRKTTMLTADGFKELIQTVSNNQNVQEDLLGLAPRERAARQQQLLEIGALGHRMGLTQQAAGALTQALLDQRKATAQQRFQAAGLIRQAGAMTGMGAGETEELAKLRMKKRRSPEEEARFVELSGRLEERLQVMQNSGNIQAEFLAEKMSELLGSTPQGQVQQAAGAAKLQTDSGKPQNVDIGKETPIALQKLGETLTTLSGFMKNPLADAMVTFGSMLVQAGIQVFWLKRINDGINRLGGGPGGASGIMKGTKGGKGGKGIFGRMRGGLAAAGAAASSGLSSFGQFFAETVTSAGGIDISGGPKREKGIGDRIAKQNEAAAAKKAARASKRGKMFSNLKALPGKLVDKMFGLDVLDSIDLNGDLTPAKAEKGMLSKLGPKLGQFAKGSLRMLFKVGGPLALVGAMWDALDEVFTGNLGAAFGEAETASVDFKKAGWLWDLVGVVANKLDDMVLSIFRGAATIFTDLGDVVLHAIGVDTQEMFGGTLTNLFDRLLTDIIGTWKTIKIGAMEGINKLSGILGFKVFDDKTIKDAEKELDTTIETRNKLAKDGTATLTTIGEENNKVLTAQKDAAKKAAADTSKATTALKDNVVFGLDALAASAQRTVQAVQAVPAGSTGAQVAVPEPTKQAGVVPPEVNKTQVADADTKKAEDAAKAKEVLGPDAAKDEAILVMKQQLQVMQQMLAYWTNQEDLSEALLKAGSRPSLPSNEKLYVAALGRRTA